MNLQISIIILAALFGLIYTFRITQTFARVITWIMVVAIAVSFVQIPAIAVDGYHLLGIAVLLTIVYAFSFSSFPNRKKIVIASMALLNLLPILNAMAGSPITFDLRFVGFFILAIYSYALIKDIKLYKEEMGFLTILAAIALDIVISFSRGLF